MRQTIRERSKGLGFTLKEFLKDKPTDLLVKIGSAVGWVFIGTIAEWNEDKVGIDAELMMYQEKLALKSKRVAEYIPFDEREVKEVYQLRFDKYLYIATEGKDFGTAWTHADYKGISDKASGNAFIRRRYKLKDGNIVCTVPADDKGYEKIRDIIVKARADSYREAYAAYRRAITPSDREDTAIRLELARAKFDSPTVQSLIGGLDTKEVIRMIERRFDKI